MPHRAADCKEQSFVLPLFLLTLLSSVTFRVFLHVFKSSARQKNRPPVFVILTTAQETHEFITDAIRGVAGQITKAYGKVGAEMAGDIQAVSGLDIDVTGWYLELVPHDLQHAFRQHEKAKRQGNIDLTEQDFLNIPDYIDSYDDILEVNTFRGGDREVVIGKKINGYSVIVELISTNRKSLHFKNMWGLDTPTYEKRYGKRGGSTASHPGRSSVSANDPTGVYHGTSSGLSISQPTQVVNPRLALPGDIPADIPPGLHKLYLLAQEMSASPPPREIPQRPVQQSPQEILSQLAREMAMDPRSPLDDLSNEDIRAMLEEIAAGNEGLQSDTGDGILTSGAISGALNPEGKRARKHAVTYYGLVRKMTTDVARIAKNTGYSEEQIQRIKNFLFVDEHDLGGGKVARFDPSYEIAQSWQRLLDGKEIQPHDLTLLMHEILESELMGKGHTQDEAHRIASKKYDYRREAEEYYGQAEEYS